ncbi:unnamed protein product [Cyprideis torosa]|uniref:Uncharacterized protein n=1 Tax=Cyprideis torosa TaxID=163714 RepID=A0A7R8W7W6_9CRUS|nr:unnamed protein product [Cyprideis torosa]CAG0886817.1 unnamed protein product [Cyprideis torosa]
MEMEEVGSTPPPSLVVEDSLPSLFTFTSWASQIHLRDCFHHQLKFVVSEEGRAREICNATISMEWVMVGQPPFLVVGGGNRWFGTTGFLGSTSWRLSLKGEQKKKSAEEEEEEEAPCFSSSESAQCGCSSDAKHLIRKYLPRKKEEEDSQQGKNSSMKAVHLGIGPDRRLSSEAKRLSQEGGRILLIRLGEGDV